MATLEPKWVKRWKYDMTEKALRPGVWGLKTGGFLVRARVADRRTGKTLDRQKILRDMTLNEAEAFRNRLAFDARELASGRKRTPTQWSLYAASLFKAKVDDGTIKSAKNREHWLSVLARLVPEIGGLYVDDLTHHHLAAWRVRVNNWILKGMPSHRKRDKVEKNGKMTAKLVPLSPVTANNWIRVLKVICRAMKIDFELEKDPSEHIKPFHQPRKYTREQPNSLTAKQLPLFLDKMKELYPQFYAMVVLGFTIGARPSSLRPLRRRGPEADILWEDGHVLLRRSHSTGQEIMDQTKTGQDQEIALPPHTLDVLRAHVASLKGRMAKSDYLFPSVSGDLRTRTVLKKPFDDVVAALGWTLKLTPRAMRRTFQDLARKAGLHDVIRKSISGHATEEMHHLYSTAHFDEQRVSLSRIVGFFVLPPLSPALPALDGAPHTRALPPSCATAPP